MKKIKITIKDLDKNEFTILENASEGDYFSLNDLTSYDSAEFQNTIKTEIEKRAQAIYDEKISSERINIINSYKLSEEFKSFQEKENELQNSIRILNSKLENSKTDAVKDFKLSAEYKSLEKAKDDLNYKIEALNNSFNDKLKLKENEVKLILTEDFAKKEKAFEQIIKDKEALINEKDSELQRRAIKNIKEMGEDLEDWVDNELHLQFGMNKKIEFEKTTKSIGGTKPDFIFKIKGDDDLIIETIIIEAKTEATAGGKTKNRDHYDKLDKDRKNYQADYAILVSELENTNNAHFIFKRIPNDEFENMFVVRPPYLTTFLHLIKDIAAQKSFINSATINFKDKQTILNEFEEMKTEILANSIKNIEANCNDIISRSDKINQEASKIRESANKILSTHLNTVRNKIDDFRIKKVISKIEKSES
ncbi:MAG: DUF2130 domain-containing protein [Mycoplasmoidaceae bacterium]